MNQVHSPTRTIRVVIVAFSMSTCFALPLVSAEKTYFPKSADETEVLSLVLKSEVDANKWAKKDKICFSVEGMNPSPRLVKAFRQQDLNVCSSAEWRKKFNCGFEVLLQFLSFNTSQGARVRAEVIDLREINEGVGHFAIRHRDGEYSVRKIDGKWLIREYVPSK